MRGNLRNAINFTRTEVTSQPWSTQFQLFHPLFLGHVNLQSPFPRAALALQPMGSGTFAQSRASLGVPGTPKSAPYQSTRQKNKSWCWAQSHHRAVQTVWICTVKVHHSLQQTYFMESTKPAPSMGELRQSGRDLVLSCMTHISALHPLNSGVGF